MIYVFLTLAVLSTIFLYSIAVSLGLIAEIMADKEK